MYVSELSLVVLILVDSSFVSILIRFVFLDRILES